jgi:hypothetical protein
MVQSLERITLEVLLISIHQQPTLGKLPEHLALQLFDSVLASGKLTPQVRDNDLASDGSPNKAHKTVIRIIF